MFIDTSQTLLSKTLYMGERSNRLLTKLNSPGAVHWTVPQRVHQHGCHFDLRQIEM